MRYKDTDGEPAPGSTADQIERRERAKTKERIKQNREVAAAIVDYMPVAGQVKSAVEVVTGVDMITGEELTVFDRCTGAISLIPFGKVVKSAKSIKRAASAADDVADAVKRGGRHADDAADAMKRTGSCFTAEMEVAMAVNTPADATTSRKEVFAGFGHELSWIAIAFSGFIVGQTMLPGARQKRKTKQNGESVDCEDDCEPMEGIAMGDADPCRALDLLFSKTVGDSSEARVGDRGREGRLSSASPPAEPDWRVSRIRLSG